MKYTDLAIEEDGNLLVLVTSIGVQRTFTLTRCNPNGEPLENIEIANPPSALTVGSTPLSLCCRERMICIVDREMGKIAAFDPNGHFVQIKQLERDSVSVSRGGESEGTTLSPISDVENGGWERLMKWFFSGLQMITKPSFARNSNDSVKSLFSRNGLLISGINNKLSD